MYIYEIRVQGRLDQRWSEWFEGLAITYDADENTVLRGPLVDEAAGSVDGTSEAEHE
jgi:hypothetical protein